MKSSDFWARASGIALASVILPLTAAHAAGYPEKPVRWVVPSAAGGGTDTTTRIVAPKLAELLGQQIVIENRPGASGNIGVEYVARAVPDGYTLVTVILSNTSNIALMKKVPFDILRDLAPVSLMVTVPVMILAHPSLPAKNVRELVALAKARPGELQYSSSGVGSNQHMALELFQVATGTRMLHIPYKATHPALIDALAGQVPITAVSSVTGLPHVRSGRLRTYGVTSSQRMSIAPDIPTIAEQGVPGYEAVQWWGMLAPANTQRDIIMKLHAAMLRALQDPEVKRRLLDDGAEIKPSATPEEFGAMMRSEVAKWARVVKEARIQPE
jgi:tripartite-type tricarboxylate transporter receptor subunit TctC